MENSWLLMPPSHPRKTPCARRWTCRCIVTSSGCDRNGKSPAFLIIAWGSFNSHTPANLAGNEGVELAFVFEFDPLALLPGTAAAFALAARWGGSSLRGSTDRITRRNSINQLDTVEVCRYDHDAIPPTSMRVILSSGSESFHVLGSHVRQLSVSRDAISFCGSMSS